MKKVWTVVLVFSSLAMTGNPSTVIARHSLTVARVPREAIVALRLLRAPGLGVAGSNWEIAYEFRMMPESNLWSERDKLKEGSTQRAGDLLKKATLAKSIQSSGEQTLLLEIPFSATTLEKLKGQPNDRSVPGQDSKSQIFLFYSVISVHDFKLKKTITIPVTRIWDFANFRDARFEVALEINDDGSYAVNSSHIKGSKRGTTIVR